MKAFIHAMNSLGRPSILEEVPCQLSYWHLGEEMVMLQAFRKS